MANAMLVPRLLRRTYPAAGAAVVALMALTGAGLGLFVSAYRMGDTYHRTILVHGILSGLGLALFSLLFTFFGVGVCGAALLRPRRGRVMLIVCGLIFLGGGLAMGAAGIHAVGIAIADYVSGPATMQGPLTDRHEEETDEGEDGTTTTYYLTVGGIRFSNNVGSSTYDRVTPGACLTVIYGPRTRIVADVHDCGAGQ